MSLQVSVVKHSQGRCGTPRPLHSLQSEGKRCGKFGAVDVMKTWKRTHVQPPNQGNHISAP